MRLGVPPAGLVAFVGTLAAGARADTLVAGAPADAFSVTDYVSGLSQPTGFVILKDGSTVVTERAGSVLLVAPDGSRRTIGSFRVDIASEKGLLNVLAPPDFESKRALLFYYSAANTIGGTDTDRNRVVEVPLDASGALDMTREKILVRGLRGPLNHDGGALAIGPDGKLYIGVGDSGCNSKLAPEPPYPPTNYFATCLTNGNGKILRVNLDGSVPADNPLVGREVTSCGATCDVDVTQLPLAEARTEVWAWGFRNPWRFSFDPFTGNLWVGDVGEVSYEEIDVISSQGAGKHYGWPWREGAKGHPTSACRTTTPSGDCVDPQYYCAHGASSDPTIDGSCESITGGYVVRSCEFPLDFRGRYFFADNANDWIATLRLTADGNGVVPGSREMFIKSTGLPVNFGIGPDGALYYSKIVAGAPSGGAIERIFPKTKAQCVREDAGLPGSDAAVRSDAAAPRDAARDVDGSAGRTPVDASPPRDASKEAERGGDATARASPGCSCTLRGANSGVGPPRIFGIVAWFLIRRRKHRKALDRRRRSSSAFRRTIGRR